MSPPVSPLAVETFVTVPAFLIPVQSLGVVIVMFVPSTVAIVAEEPAAARDALLFSTWFSPFITSQSASEAVLPAFLQMI